MGKGIWQVDGDDVQEDWRWDQPEEERPSKREEVSIIDQDGYELMKRPRRLAQFMPEIFAVDADGSGDGVAKELRGSCFAEWCQGNRKRGESYQRIEGRSKRDQSDARMGESYGSDRFRSD